MASQISEERLEEIVAKLDWAGKGTGSLHDPIGFIGGAELLDDARLLLAEIDRLREREKALSVFEDYVRRIECEHYEVGGPHLPAGVYECICETDDCPELAAHDELVADLKELNYVDVLRWRPHPSPSSPEEREDG